MFNWIKGLFKKNPKVATAVTAAGVAAAGIYGGPAGAELAATALSWIFG